MQWQNVGRSGLQVSRLGLGTMTWGLDVDEEAASEQLRLFTEAGGTLVSTAARYSDGRAEAMLGALIGDAVARTDVVLAVQAGSVRSAGERRLDVSRKGLLDSLDASLSRLGTDHIDLWLVPARDQAVPLDETLSALESAYRSGRARYVGVADHAGWELAQTVAAAGFPVVAHEAEYSLANRSVEREALAAGDALGVGLLAWGPLGRGVLTGKYRGRTPSDSRAASDLWSPYVDPYLTGRPAQIAEALHTAAQGLELTDLDLCLRWLLHRPTVAAAVVGARTSLQLKEILNVEFKAIPGQITDVLDEVSAAAE
jgi:aryl-alcohol dehydrogenase-like predicted oxidoreductase